MKLILLSLSTLTLCSAAETLLFVDDHDILYRPATKRVLHQPVRHDANPLLTGPSLKHQVAYCSVYRDPATGRYQMWYQMTGAGCVHISIFGLNPGTARLDRRARNC